MNWNDLENKFQGLNEHSLAPSPSTTFEEVMNRRKKKKRRVIAYWSFTGVALIGVFGLISNSYFNSVNSLTFPEEKNVLNQKQTKKETTAIKIEVGTKYSNQNSSTTSDVKSPEENNSGLSLSSTDEFSNKSIVSNTPIPGNTNNYTRTKLPQKTIAVSSETHSTTQNIPNGNIEVMSSESSQYISRVESVQEYLNGESTRASSSSNSNSTGKSNFDKLNINLTGSLLKPIKINWDPQLGRIDWIEGPWDLDPRTPYIDKRPMYLEFSAITGSRSQVDFDMKQTTSILGTQYMAQYQLLLLRETWDEFLWGLGVQYTEWIGNGQWRNVERFNVQVIDTSYRIVKIPGQPDHKIQIIDTFLKEESNTTTGKIGYKMDNIAIPISFRKITSGFRTPIRIGVQISPGFTTYTRGEYFSATEFQAIGKTRRPTLNAKLSAGPQIQVTGDFCLTIEPSLMYHSFVDVQSKFNGRWFSGLGVSMQWRIK